MKAKAGNSSISDHYIDLPHHSSKTFITITINECTLCAGGEVGDAVGCDIPAALAEHAATLSVKQLAMP